MLENFYQNEVPVFHSILKQVPAAANPRWILTLPRVTGDTFCVWLSIQDFTRIEQALWVKHMLHSTHERELSRSARKVQGLFF